MVLFIPLDFSIEFWNCTFPLALKFLKGIFWTTSARAFEWYKPRKCSYFCSKVINSFYHANSTWTYYSMTQHNYDAKMHTHTYDTIHSFCKQVQGCSSMPFISGSSACLLACFLLEWGMAPQGVYVPPPPLSPRSYTYAN